VIRKNTKMRHFLMKPNENASISLCVRPSKNLDKRLWCPPYQCQSLHFPKQTCQNCVHYISHYTFLNKHVKIASTISITAHFLHKHEKIFLVSTISATTLFLHKHVKIASTIPITTLFLYKHVKIASHFPSVHYINHYTFLIQISQNCVHMQVSTISITTHFLHNLSVESLSQ